MEDVDGDEQEIRALIERWAAAVHAGDMEGVLADHAADIVMFDVPPPDDGVRGLDAYGETWPPLLRVAGAGRVVRDRPPRRDGRHPRRLRPRPAALRDPRELDGNPEHRLRLTLGLRKEGRWIVAHEHHSFADTTG